MSHGNAKMQIFASAPLTVYSTGVSRLWCAFGRDGLMPYYSLLIEPGKTLSSPALDRQDALDLFGKELGLTLSVEDLGKAVAPYLLDEWEGGPHWVNHRIPVFANAAV